MNAVLYQALGAYVLLTAIFIVSENRRPQATFAWMLLFFAAPGFGVLIYILFGRERKAFSRERKLTRHDLIGRLRPLSPILANEERRVAKLEARSALSERLARLGLHSAHAGLTTHNRLEVLQNASEKYPRLIEDLKGARHSIHMQYFSWASDAFTDELKTILIAKAQAGIEVRILYDPIGSLTGLSGAYIRAMRAGGVAMKPFARLWWLHTIGYRNHRKIVVIDGVIGYTGGMNIGQEHLDGGPRFDVWRDTHLRIVGEAATILQIVFAVDWSNADDEDLLVPAYFPPVPDEAADADLPIQITVSGPDSEWRAIQQLYFTMITGARDHVFLQSPFFILDDSLAEALKAAALGGVDVRIMLQPGVTQNVLPYWAGNTYMAEVAAAGAKIFLYRGGYLHAKTISIDSEVCSVGSANMDIRSFSINYEVNAIVFDEAVTRKLERDFLSDQAACERFDLAAYRQGNRLRRFRDSTARLFSPLL